MATAYKCDMCGLFYEKFNNITLIRGKQIYFSPEAKSTYGHTKKDFCKKCMIKLCEGHINYLKQEEEIEFE